jgi:hypothetical protein
MAGLDLAVQRAVENASTSREGNRAGVVRYFGRNLGPAKWLIVVVAYDSKGRGNILTAYPQAKDPEPEERAGG